MTLERLPEHDWSTPTHGSCSAPVSGPLRITGPEHMDRSRTRTLAAEPESEQDKKEYNQTRVTLLQVEPSTGRNPGAKSEPRGKKNPKPTSARQVHKETHVGEASHRHRETRVMSASQPRPETQTLGARHRKLETHTRRASQRQRENPGRSSVCQCPSETHELRACVRI